MMLAEIVTAYPYASADDYNWNYIDFNDNRKKYWLNAMIYSAE